MRPSVLWSVGVLTLPTILTIGTTVPGLAFERAFVWTEASFLRLPVVRWSSWIERSWIGD